MYTNAIWLLASRMVRRISSCSRFTLSTSCTDSSGCARSLSVVPTYTALRVALRCVTWRAIVFAHSLELARIHLHTLALVVTRAIASEFQRERAITMSRNATRCAAHVDRTPMSSSSPISSLVGVRANL